MAARCSSTYLECFENIWAQSRPFDMERNADVARIDYLDDPAAPKANSIVPAVSAVVTDDQGRILLIRRTDNNYWSIPGGGMEPGESVREAAIREVKEETGMRLRDHRPGRHLLRPRHVAAYDDGEVRQEFSICLCSAAARRELQTSAESSEVRFISQRRSARLQDSPIDTTANRPLS